MVSLYDSTVLGALKIADPATIISTPASATSLIWKEATLGPRYYLTISRGLASKGAYWARTPQSIHLPAKIRCSYPYRTN